MSTLPVTMTVDDELARLRSMLETTANTGARLLADLRALNADFARICDERDRYRAALVAISRDHYPTLLLLSRLHYRDVFERRLLVMAVAVAALQGEPPRDVLDQA